MRDFISKYNYKKTKFFISKNSFYFWPGSPGWLAGGWPGLTWDGRRRRRQDRQDRPGLDCTQSGLDRVSHQSSCTVSSSTRRLLEIPLPSIYFDISFPSPVASADRPHFKLKLDLLVLLNTYTSLQSHLAPREKWLKIYWLNLHSLLMLNKANKTF